MFETFDSLALFCSESTHPFSARSLFELASPPSSPVGVPELRSDSPHKGYFYSFWVETSFLLLTGFSRLVTRIDSRSMLAKQFQFLLQRLQEGGMRVLSKKDQDEGNIKKHNADLISLVLFFYIIDKDKSPLHLQVLPTPLADDITMLLLYGRLHALLIRSLLFSCGSFLLLSHVQSSATIKGFRRTLMLKGKLSKF